MIPALPPLTTARPYWPLQAKKLKRKCCGRNCSHNACWDPKKLLELSLSWTGRGIREGKDHLNHNRLSTSAFAPTGRLILFSFTFLDSSCSNNTAQIPPYWYVCFSSPTLLLALGHSIQKTGCQPCSLIFPAHQQAASAGPAIPPCHQYQP